MMRLLARVMPPCKEVAAWVSEGMDRRLPLSKRLSVRLHLWMCTLCRRYARQLYFLREGAVRYGNPEENPVMPPLSPAARERLRRKLRE